VKERKAVRPAEYFRVEARHVVPWEQQATPIPNCKGQSQQAELTPWGVTKETAMFILER
jgi:hypothetical protein